MQELEDSARDERSDLIAAVMAADAEIESLRQQLAAADADRLVKQAEIEQLQAALGIQ